MDRIHAASLRHLFSRAVDVPGSVGGATGESAPTLTPDGRNALKAPITDPIPDEVIRRMPVPQRGQVDYEGETMARYINGLEMRLVRHLWRNAPLWHARETSKVLGRWDQPAARHPRPGWVMARDVIGEAQGFAAHALRERMMNRMQRLDDIRRVRVIDQPRLSQALRQEFGDAAASPKQHMKQKR